MSPKRTDVEGLTKQFGATVLVGAAQEDDHAFELRVQIETEVSRHGTALGRLFPPGTAARTMRAHVACAGRFDLGNSLELRALPDLCLPQAVKAFDRVLESGFARRGKYRDYPSARHSRLTRPTALAN